MHAFVIMKRGKWCSGYSYGTGVGESYSWTDCPFEAMIYTQEPTFVPKGASVVRVPVSAFIACALQDHGVADSLRAELDSVTARAEVAEARVLFMDAAFESAQSKYIEAAATIRNVFTEYEQQIARVRAERDARPEITPELAAQIADWIDAEVMEAIDAPVVTPDWVSRASYYLRAHAEKAQK